VLDDAEFQRVARALPFLRNADPRLVREFRQVAFLARIPVGHDVFTEGDLVDAIALLISGVVRVYKIGETGRELTLYRFGSGESCILTANAILSRKMFPAVATVEKEAEAAMVPADKFRAWITSYDLWRDFVFDLLSERLSSVMEIVDEIAFRRMDVRIAKLLLERYRPGNPIQITHQEIASELGSSREVISRLLEDLSEQQIVRPARGQIEVIDVEALRALVST
jgi:CRP/FNR family transcriptional regulator, anaerobic regulatory protein